MGYNEVDDISEIECKKMFVYDRGKGRKTAFLHYPNGVEIWDTCPSLWKGWRCGFRLINGKEKY